MKRALLPGTFDPLSLGHLDIIQRASRLCEKLLIGIAYNINKPQKMFTLAEKEEMIRANTADLSNIEVITFSGLVVECAKEHHVECIVRGLRSFSDFDYELQMALANRHMAGIETLFLPASDAYSYVSSTLIREIASYRGPLDQFVPPDVESMIKQKNPHR
jgi:pantetheine-phosphate adenylyltransferase